MNWNLKFSKLSIVAILFVSCSAFSEKKSDVKPLSLIPPKGKAIAAFAEGCFWCSEHIFESVFGVEDVVSGYAGGPTPDPTYESVNTETTGHAETVLITYDPTKISYSELCRVFFASHDPTTKDRQGPDSGSSYRSILFYTNETEKKEATLILEEVRKSGRFAAPIITEFQKLTAFYQAEGYHQDFIRNNPRQSYVVNVSIPRYEQFRKVYKGKFKD
jgi:peptide-methionine (S)-S-oxide reductase